MAGAVGRLWIDAQERGLGWLERLARLRARGRQMPPHLATGLAGERAAMFHLRRLGFTIVARRWASGRVRGDVDLVAWEGERLCFIEVKTRSARTMTPAEAAVNDDKRETLRRLAREYLRGFPESERRTIAVRFDVVSVYMLGGATEFEVMRGAFGSR